MAEWIKRAVPDALKRLDLAVTSSRPHWEPDEAAAQCRRCRKPFDLLRRKHHCRQCGLLVCGPCSDAKKDVAGHEYGPGPVRVCQVCAPTQNVLADHPVVRLVDVVVVASDLLIIEAFVSRLQSPSPDSPHVAYVAAGSGSEDGAYVGTIGQQTIALVWCDPSASVGATFAAEAVSARALERWRPRIVVACGWCPGVLNASLGDGDCIVATSLAPRLTSTQKSLVKLAHPDDHAVDSVVQQIFEANATKKWLRHRAGGEACRVVRGRVISGPMLRTSQIMRDDAVAAVAGAGSEVIAADDGDAASVMLSAETHNTPWATLLTVARSDDTRGEAAASVASLFENVMLQGRVVELLRRPKPAGIPGSIQLRGHTSVVAALTFLDDLDLLLSAGWDGSIRTWSLSGKALTCVETAHNGSVLCACVLSTGKHVATGGDDNTVCVWSVAASGKVKKLATMTGHTGSVQGIAALADNLVVSGSVDRSLRVWPDVTGGAGRRRSGSATRRRSSTGAGVQALHVMNGHTTLITCVAALPDGKHVVSAGWSSTARVWNAATGSLRSTLAGHAEAINTVCAVNDRLVVTGSMDHVIRLFDWQSGDLVRSFKGHTGGVWGLGFSVSGRMYSVDGSLRTWSWQSGKCFEDVSVPGQVSSLAVSKTRLALGLQNGHVLYVSDLPDQFMPKDS